MSDSTDTLSAIKPETAGPPAASPRPNDRVASKSPSAAPPVSSPPVHDDDARLPRATSPGKAAPGADDEDAQDDSEAETLISSPVKIREALKRANGIKKEFSDPQNLARLDDNTLSMSAGQPGVIHGMSKQGADEASALTEEDNVVVVNGVAEDEEGEDSDQLSDVTSISASEDADSRASSQSPEASAADGDAEVPDGHAPRNPRKRKYRESSAKSAGPPRRRRRASDGVVAENAMRSSAETSPPGRLRSHRRTTSAQIQAHDDAASVGVANGGSGRKRRAATHFPVRAAAKSTRNTWDSDESSEASHKRDQNRLVRSINRSVSTPGRTMGRDHKRHVNKYGFTRLAEACESGDLDQVKEWRKRDPEQLEQREFAGNTPLQVASLNGYPEIVQDLLEAGCSPHCVNTDKDTPLIDAVENGHVEVVRILLQAGVDPLRQNMKGQQALDVITEQTDNWLEMRTLLRQAIEDWTAKGTNEETKPEEEQVNRPGPRQGLQFMARTYENLLKLVSNNDRSGVQEFLDARVPVDNAVVAAAARTGDLYLVNMLLAEMTPKKARSRPERPMLSAIGTSHYEVVKTLTELDQFNPVWRSKSNGLTWYELAESRQGVNAKQERLLLKQLYDDCVMASRLSSSPVTKRDNGKRRRLSPTRRRDSDLEMEDADSLDLGRSRRRLMSKKAMRAASNRRSSSLESAGSSSPMSSRPRLDSDSPPLKRKVGRPRTKSLTAHAAERQPKRIRSSSMRDNAPQFDSPQGNALRSRDLQGVITEDPEEEIKQEMAADGKAAENRIEQARVAEEARRKEEAEREELGRLAEEARLKREREESERRLEAERIMSILPSALRHVLGLPSEAVAAKKKYIQRHFLPIQAVKGSALGVAEQSTDDHGEQGDAWVLNYQAAGILTCANAAPLLDIPGPTDTDAANPPLPSAPTRPATDDHRIAMLASLQSSSLVHALFDPADHAQPLGSVARELAQAARARQLVNEDRARFMHLPSLRWMPLRALDAAVAAARQRDGGAHLEGLELDVRFDACLDAAAFDAEPDGAGDAGAGAGADAVGLANGSLVQQGGAGVTKVVVVQD